LHLGFISYKIESSHYRSQTAPPFSDRKGEEIMGNKGSNKDKAKKENKKKPQHTLQEKRKLKKEKKNKK